MRIVWKSFKLLGFLSLLILLSGVVYFGTAEFYIYFTQSEAKARAAAQAMFTKICDREGLDPNSFRGPERASVQLDDKRGQYTFIWSRTPEETIFVNVSYFPYDFAYSISAAITERKRNARPRP